MWDQIVGFFKYVNDCCNSSSSSLESAIKFFVVDTIKIFLLLSVTIFVVAIIRSFFPPEKTKKYLSHKKQFLGNIFAALFGVVTPFCSCSAVPLFIGFVEAGVPLGVTFSFLISSPMVNEVALTVLWEKFGWKIALIYIASGLTVAIIGGFIMGRMKLEHLVEDYVYQIKGVGTAAVAGGEMAWSDRINYAQGYVKDILKRVWLFIIIGIAVGAAIHGYAPENFLAEVAGPDNPLAVPVAVLIGVPLYSNAAGTIVIANELYRHGMAMGTALAFMMAVTALSLPEAIILRRVLKPKLLLIYFGTVALAIIAIGYLFNAIL